MPTIKSIFSWLLIVLFCSSCLVTKTDLSNEPGYLNSMVGLRKQDVIVLKKPCSFINFPGTTKLIPSGWRSLEDNEQIYNAGLVLEGTRIKFLGTYKVDVFMSDQVENYEVSGRFLNGKFKGKKVELGELIGAQMHEPIYFEKLKN